MKITPRQQELLNFLKPIHFASITEIAGNLFTSEATVRRDVKALQEMGFVKSVYGGVVISEYANEAVPVYLRDGSNSAQKELLAAAAAELIGDNCTVIFDSSSTVRRICRHIRNRKNLTVITSNLRVCQELSGTDIHVYCTGGALLPRRECFAGHFAEEFMRRVKADLVFFSCQGLAPNGDISDSSEEEIALRNIMLKNARQQIFLCDSSKLGAIYPFTLCNARDVTKILCDTDISDFLQQE